MILVSARPAEPINDRMACGCPRVHKVVATGTFEELKRERSQGICGMAVQVVAVVLFDHLKASAGQSCDGQSVKAVQDDKVCDRAVPQRHCRRGQRQLGCLYGILDGVLPRILVPRLAISACQERGIWELALALFAKERIR